MLVSPAPKGPAYQPYQCVVCQSRFTRHENLKRHVALHSRSKNDASLPCHFCQATFSRPDLRQRHLKRKHPEHTDQDEKRTRRRSPRDVGDGGRRRASKSLSASPAASHHGSHTQHSDGEGELELATSVDSGIGHMSMHFDHRAESGPRVQTTEPTLLPGVSFLDPTHNFDAQMHATPPPPPPAQFPPFNTDLASFSFDHGFSEKALSIDLSPRADDWAPSGMQIARGCDLFFAHVLHFVPFLHQPTFDAAQVPSHLLLSMLSLAYQHAEDPECGDRPDSGANLSVRCFHRARMLTAREDKKTGDSMHSVSLVQAYLLLEIYAMMYSCANDSAYGLKTHSKMVSLARSGGLVQPIISETAATQDLDSLWRQFIKAESHKRTLFAVHQIDTLWYQFLSIPRLLSHLEIKHDLPCPQDYWTASSSVEWAHMRLTASHSSSSLQYQDAVRRFLSSADLDSLPAFDPYGTINLTHFLISSAREISGWSTMTGMLSMERIEPLRTSLLALGPFIRAQSPPHNNNNNNNNNNPHSALCEATWETAMLEMQMWSPSHTGGIVEGSIDAVLHQLTYLAPCSDFLCEPATATVVQPHVDWFLRYLDDSVLRPDAEAPWVLLYAYKAFLIAWQMLRGGVAGAMQVVGVRDGDVEGALAWARDAFRRRERWKLGKIVMTCLDVLGKEGEERDFFGS